MMGSTSKFWYKTIFDNNAHICSNPAKNVKATSNNMIQCDNDNDNINSVLEIPGEPNKHV